MNVDDRLSTSNERRWTISSYAAAGFALFLFLYTLVTTLITITRPIDGWRTSGDLNTGSPQIELVNYFLSQTSPIQPEDVLLAINDQPIVEILDAQHAFFRLRPPDLPDGTRLKYTLLRNEQTINVDVPIQRVSFWTYFNPYRQASSSQIVQLFGSLFFFTISVIVFLLRPGNRAAHALLFIGVGFFFVAVPANFSPPALFYPAPPVSIPFDAWTLAIAALFYPLRRRVQDLIDRRVFRKKYNAEQALAQFAIAARGETDLGQLSADLLAVVQETMQPEKAELWLRESKK